MQKYHKSIFWAIIASEASHIFCCVLPAVFSILSLLGGLGLIVSMPGWMESLHEVMHRWEVPMIALSVLVIGLGWGLYLYGGDARCADHECSHGSCSSHKKFSKRILLAATVLLVFNLTIYFVFHRNQAEIEAYVHEHEGHGHADSVEVHSEP